MVKKDQKTDHVVIKPDDIVFGGNAAHRAEADFQEHMLTLDGASALQSHLRRLARATLDAVSQTCPVVKGDRTRQVSERAAEKISECLAVMVAYSWDRLERSTSEWNVLTGVIAALGDKQIRAVVSNVWEPNLHRSEDVRRKTLASGLQDLIRRRILKTPAIATDVERLLSKWLRVKDASEKAAPSAFLMQCWKDRG